MSTIERLLASIPVPPVFRVRQSYPCPRVTDAAGELAAQIRARQVLKGIGKGRRIAVAVGSRGIANQPLLVRTLVRELRAAGAEPFLFPAMGSHGGATADGQAEMLRRLGMSEEQTGAPIRTTMDVIRLGTSAGGLPVYLDRLAAEADGIVMINRIKPHVSFRGPFESGLMKMAAIGLGKQKGAEVCHDLGFGRMAQNIPEIGRVVLASGRILFAVGLLENAYHETCRIEVLRPEEIEVREPPLQEEAKRLSPQLGFAELDVLIIDRIGKEISGTGFDTNVVGRYHTPYASGGPQIARIAALDLTDASHGNANGLGIVDFTTRRVFDKLDFESTYPNSLTSTVPASVKIPMVLESDLLAVQAAIKTCNVTDKSRVRLVRIRDTLSVAEFEASASLLEEVRGASHLEALGEPYPLPFDARGSLF